ncbi:MAG: hypothetical protein CM1200mP2_25100 [Planctomycetaceae bacterium]|nr:MAG: hypothetical protein CM1200mP2_25100 [Planctomycetaceae bacterium]
MIRFNQDVVGKFSRFACRGGCRNGARSRAGEQLASLVERMADERGCHESWRNAIFEIICWISWLRSQRTMDGSINPRPVSTENPQGALPMRLTSSTYPDCRKVPVCGPCGASWQSGCCTDASSWPNFRNGHECGVAAAHCPKSFSCFGRNRSPTEWSNVGGCRHGGRVYASTWVGNCFAWI